MSGCVTILQDSDCEVEVFLDETCDTPVILYQAGPPGPPGPSSLALKAGLIPGASFTGSPKKYTVTFITAAPDLNYAISMSSTDGRLFTYEEKLTTGFTINANAATAIAGEVSWLTTEIGESL